MKIIKQYWEFMNKPNEGEIVRLIESAGRTCYKSERAITPTSARNFVRRMLKSGHHSVIEHSNITVRIITDRGVTHEIVRHRIASYSQESTRYCNYGLNQGGITVILPVWSNIPEGEYDTPTDSSLSHINGAFRNNAGGDKYWLHGMFTAETLYNTLLKHNWSPQQARSVLPNSLKTEIVMTCNIREWRHFFNLRCSSAAHPQMRDLAMSMLEGFKHVIPTLFNDLYPTDTCNKEGNNV